MKKILVILLALLVSADLLPAQQMATRKPGTGKINRYDAAADLKPNPEQSKVEQLITQILTQGHYRKLALNDSLSSAILTEYVESWDPNRMYFLASDVAGFEKYRNQLDDDLKKGDLQPAYDVFNVFRKRFNERMTYVNSVAGQKFDFSKDETYDLNREKAPYPKTAAEANSLWHKAVKSQALNLKLAGRSDDEIAKSLNDRYDRLGGNFAKFNSEDVFSAYINSFSASIDPHTNYFSPASSANFKIDMSNSLEGIGATLSTDRDYTKVMDIIAGGPAFKSKQLLKGDNIIGVAQGAKGEMVDVIGWRIDEVVKLIRGAKGTTVRLQILPAGTTAGTATPKEITLVRDKIKIEEQAAKKEIVPVTQNGKNYKMGVITIPSFYLDYEAAQKGEKDYASTTKDVRRLLGELTAQKVDGVIIDLRNNGGGSLSEAIELTGLFIPDGPVVQVRNANGSVEVGEDPDPSEAYAGPLAVMINRFSASASEIFAGAIQDYKRGVIVGEQTYGKGTVQNLVPLRKFVPDAKEDLGEVKLTIAKFYRVTGSSTQHRGVTPDIEFPSQFSAKEFGESSQPSALPWDQIAGTKFKPTNHVTGASITKLEGNYQKRLATEPDLKELSQNVADLKKLRDDSVISLQESTRAKERVQLEKKLTATENAELPDEDASAQTNKTDSANSPDGKTEKKPKDTYLKEGTRVMADLLSAVK